jgi:hypothetical protein
MSHLPSKCHDNGLNDWMNELSLLHHEYIECLNTAKELMQQVVRFEAEYDLLSAEQKDEAKVMREKIQAVNEYEYEYDADADNDKFSKILNERSERLQEIENRHKELQAAVQAAKPRLLELSTRSSGIQNWIHSISEQMDAISSQIHSNDATDWI